MLDMLHSFQDKHKGSKQTYKTSIFNFECKGSILYRERVAFFVILLLALWRVKYATSTQAVLESKFGEFSETHQEILHTTDTNLYMYN